MRVQKCEGARPSKGWLQEKLGVCVAARAASQMLPALASTHFLQFYRSLKQSWKVTRLTRLTRAPRTSRIRISLISESISILSESFSDSYISYIANASESRPKKLEQRRPSRVWKMRDDLRWQAIARLKAENCRCLQTVFADVCSLNANQSLYRRIAESGSWP